MAEASMVLVNLNLSSPHPLLPPSSPPSLASEPETQKTLDTVEVPSVLVPQAATPMKTAAAACQQ